jgi:ribonuclease III
MLEIEGTIEEESPQDLQRRLNLSFTDIMLLFRALTHRSYLNEHPEVIEDNERLEFLGDAVLDFVVGAWLFNHYPKMSEGDLTRMRSALVYTEQLACFARKINLGSSIRLGNGEIQTGGRTKSALLCNTFEALIGAIYLSGDIQAVKDFTNPFWESAADHIITTHQNEDPKSQLQEWAQGRGFSAPIYKTRNTTGPDHAKVFEIEVIINGKVSGSGLGHSKQSATKTAAVDALRSLGIYYGQTINSDLSKLENN